MKSDFHKIFQTMGTAVKRCSNWELKYKLLSNRSSTLDQSWIDLKHFDVNLLIIEFFCSVCIGVTSLDVDQSYTRQLNLLL